MPERPDAVAYSTIANRHLANQLQVEADGSAWFVSQFTEPGMPLRALGAFHTTFPPRDPRVESVFEFAATNELTRLEPKQVIYREAPPKSVLINRGDITKAFSSDMEGVFGSPLKELEPLLQKLISELGAFPITSLNFAARLPAVECRPAESCQVDFLFRAAGNSTAGFANPRFRSEDVEGQISTEIWSDGGNEGAELMLTLSSHDYELLKGPREAVSSTVPVLELKPGESLRATLKFTIPKWKAGKYVLRSTYSSNCEPPRKGVVIGVFAADVVAFNITPASTQ